MFKNVCFKIMYVQAHKREYITYTMCARITSINKLTCRGVVTLFVLFAKGKLADKPCCCIE